MAHTRIGVAFSVPLAEFLSALGFDVVHVASPKEARQVEGEQFPWVVASSPNPALGPLISSLESRFGSVVYARLPELGVEERNMPAVPEVTAPVPVGSILDLLGLDVPDTADETLLAGDGSIAGGSGGVSPAADEVPVEANEPVPASEPEPVVEATPWGDPPVVVSPDQVDDDLVENGFDDDPVDEPTDETEDLDETLPLVDEPEAPAAPLPSSPEPEALGPSPFSAPPAEAGPSPWSTPVPEANPTPAVPPAVPPASTPPPEPVAPAAPIPVPAAPTRPEPPAPSPDTRVPAAPPEPPEPPVPPAPTAPVPQVSEEVPGAGVGLPSWSDAPASPPAPSAPVDLWDTNTPVGPTPARTVDRQCPVIVSAAGKGGVGKTLIASLLAARAAHHGGLNVVLIDANRGQGDVSSYLRLDLSKVPTVYDAAATGDPSSAIASPEKVNAARNAHLEEILFAVAAAPPPQFTDPRVVTSEVYSNVLRFARSRADLVVVDTQIMEDTDTSGLIDHFVTPTLVSGGWFLAASDMSRASVQNVQRRLNAFAGVGVPPDRMLLLFNRVDTQEVDRDALGTLFASTSRMLGIVPANPQIADAMNVGKLPHAHPDIAPLLDEALHRVTGLERFVPDPVADRPSSGGLLSRLFGKKGGAR